MIIKTSNLVREYDGLRAVDSVSLEVKKGEVFGLLGPNGAGKTTLISMLVTLRKPTSGHATINGFDISKNPEGVRKSIGIVFQDPSIDEELTAYENLELHASLYGVRDSMKERIAEVIELVGLSEKMHSIVKTFSGGMRRRLEIARGLLHRPVVLFLDEPTIGLDPQTRSAIWEYIKKLKKGYNMTIVLTTHYMEEADGVCDRVAIIDHGKIIALDSPSALKDSLGGDSIIIETSSTEELSEKLEKIGMDRYTVHDHKITLYVEAGEKKIPGIISAANESAIEIKSIKLHKPTLDDVFLHFTGKTIREENASAKDSMRRRLR